MFLGKAGDSGPRQGSGGLAGASEAVQRVLRAESWEAGEGGVAGAQRGWAANQKGKGNNRKAKMAG